MGKAREPPPPPIRRKVPSRPLSGTCGLALGLAPAASCSTGPELERRRTETGGAGACALTGPARRGAALPSHRHRPARARARVPPLSPPRAPPYGQSGAAWAQGMPGRGAIKARVLFTPRGVGCCACAVRVGAAAAAAEGPRVSRPLSPPSRGRLWWRRGVGKCVCFLCVSSTCGARLGPSSVCPVGSPPHWMWLSSWALLGQGKSAVGGGVVSGCCVCPLAFQVRFLGLGGCSQFFLVEQVSSASDKNGVELEEAEELLGNECRRELEVCTMSCCQDHLSMPLACVMGRTVLILGCRAPEVDAVPPLCPGGRVL